VGLTFKSTNTNIKYKRVATLLPAVSYELGIKFASHSVANSRIASQIIPQSRIVASVA